MDTAYEALADQFRTARRAMRPKVTQADVAAGVGISEGTVSNFERKRTVPDDLRAMLRFVGLDESLIPGPQVGNGTAEPAVIEELDVCDKCKQVLWPAVYRLGFDILGAHLDTLASDNERVEFLRHVTAPIFPRQR